MITPSTLNHIANASPKKIEIEVAETMKLLEYKNLIAEKLNPTKTQDELNLFFQGKDLNKDNQTLRDYKIKTGSKLILSKKQQTF
jgi:hypothetical protein